MEENEQAKKEMASKVIRDNNSKIAKKEDTVVKFKIGGLVKLKSGGPEMTVVAPPIERKKVNSSDEETVYLYSCAWFNGRLVDGNTFYRSDVIFPGEALKLVDEKPQGNIPTAPKRTMEKICENNEPIGDGIGGGR